MLPANLGSFNVLVPAAFRNHGVVCLLCLLLDLRIASIGRVTTTCPDGRCGETKSISADCLDTSSRLLSSFACLVEKVDIALMLPRITAKRALLCKIGKPTNLP